VYSIAQLGPSKPAFKTRFAFNERGISPKHKITNKHNNKKTKKLKENSHYSFPLSNRGAMAKASGAEVPGKHDDKVLVQLVLTHSG
jgi:hypothetical protein